MPDEVIEIHSGADYPRLHVGICAGISLPRRYGRSYRLPAIGDTEKLLVPAGSVGIAEAQTGVYPNASPGGWQLIGRTPMALFDVESDPPSAAMLPGTKGELRPHFTHDRI